MAAHWLQLLLEIVLVSSTALGDNAQCSVSPSVRTDCGSPGISANDCLSKGCCYDSSVPGVIWCFNPIGQQVAASNAQCSVSPSVRTECGSPGISAIDCLSKGCCYDSSVPGVLWCFNPKSPSQPTAAMPPGQQPAPAAVQPLGIVIIGGPSGPSGTGNAQCSVSPSVRTECGSPGISANDCLSKGCCYDSSVPGVLWCFNPIGQPAADSNTQCSVSPSVRTLCGFPGISANDCLSKGCCYDSSVPGVLWCFNPKSPSQPTAAMPPGQQPVPAPAAVQPLGIMIIGGPSGPSGTGNDQCSANPPDRTDCGFPGISEKNCLSRGCCFNSSVPGVIWCFNPKDKTAKNTQCSVNPPDRTDCGFPGIGENNCLSRGCCFNPSVPGVIWCFKPKGNQADNTRCSVNPTNRRDCGFPGIGENECISRGCCYDSSIPGSIWCFSGSY